MPKILLVEDNVDNRDMLCRRLVRKGYEVIVAADGGEAVERTVAERPDLVLMDLSLPGVDGWDATRQLRSRSDVGHVPIIALTAHAMVGDREKALAAGCDDYESKPVDMERLLEKMALLLSESGPARQDAGEKPGAR